MVNPGDEHKANCFYQSNDKDGEARIGRHLFSKFHSNHCYWSVEDGASGWAFGGLQSRWMDAAGGYPRLGPEFLFWNGVVPGAESTVANELEVTFAFSCGNLDACAPDTPLAMFRLDSHVKDGSMQCVRHRIGNGELRGETVITKADYLALPMIFDKGMGKRILTLEVPFTSFYGPDPGRETDDAVTANGMYLELVNLDPLMYWYGNGSLQLDYVEFHDAVFDRCCCDRDLLALLPGSGLTGELTLPPPSPQARPGNIAAYRKMMQNLNEREIQITTAGSGKPGLCAINDQVTEE
jgi:hypothetical protein